MRVLKGLFLLGLMMLVSVPALSQDWAGKVTEVEGQVKIVRSGGETAVKTGTVVMPGDAIVTGANSRVRIWFRDESVITLAPGSRFRVDSLEYQPGTKRRSAFTLVSGKARAMISGWFSNTPEQDYQIKALSTVAGVRGTEIIIEVHGSGNSAGALFAGVSGTVTLWNADNPDKKVSLPANYFLDVLNGALPGNPRPLSTEQLLELLEDLGLISGSRPDREERILVPIFMLGGHGHDHDGEPIEIILVFPEGSGKGDNDHLNPADLIFQEPPGLTPVSIILNGSDLHAPVK